MYTQQELHAAATRMPNLGSTTKMPDGELAFLHQFYNDLESMLIGYPYSIQVKRPIFKDRPPGQWTWQSNTDDDLTKPRNVSRLTKP